MLLEFYNIFSLYVLQDLLMRNSNIFYHLMNNGNAVLLLRIYFCYQLFVPLKEIRILSVLKFETIVILSNLTAV